MFHSMTIWGTHRTSLRAPSLTGYVLHAPTDAVCGWWLLAERLRQLPDNLEWSETAYGYHDAERLESALRALDWLEISLPLSEDDLIDQHPILLRNAKLGQVAQLAYYGPTSPRWIAHLDDLAQFCEALQQEYSGVFVGYYLRLSPQSHWRIGAELGVELLKNLRERVK